MLKSDDHDLAKLALAPSLATSAVVAPMPEEAGADHNSEQAAKVVASTVMLLGEATSKPNVATSLLDRLAEDEARLKLPEQPKT